MAPEKSCGVVVFRTENPKPGTEKPERLYLLLHYEEGHWDFPKGHVEEGEDEAETARRETLEEAGLSDLEFVSGFRERMEYSYEREGKTVHKEVFFFLAETKTRDVKLSYEHIGYEWLPFGGAVGKLTFKNAKEMLRKADRFLGG